MMNIGVFFLTMFCWSLNLSVYAQSIVAQVKSKSVQAGVPFEFKIVISGSVSSARQPDFRGFDIVSGPDQTNSIQFTNGIRWDSTILSFKLVARNEGKYSIGPASAVFDGQRLETAPVDIICNLISEQNHQIHSKDHDIYTSKKGTSQITYSKKLWTSRSNENWEFFVKDTHYRSQF